MPAFEKTEKTLDTKCVIEPSRNLLAALLIVGTLAVYWQSGNNDFVNYDDPGYVTGNPHALSGLTIANVRWAFSTTALGNWHPLTWLSHMTDCQIYGLTPRGHHLTSILFHLVNTVLLFLLLTRLTGATLRSAFVAALFALHPLHVESVAWISERKDVLSMLFFMLALSAYSRYVERPGGLRYLAVFILFALGLMAKPMLITLPFVLLLLDFWPLGRFHDRNSAIRLFLEKIPLILLSIISGIITVVVQNSGVAIATLVQLPLSARIENALLAYAIYIGKMIWPSRLVPFYPLLPQHLTWHILAAFLLIAGVSAEVCRRAFRSPYLPVGWFWFLGMLVPVIGLVQVGMQVIADRYTYIPLIGLFIMIAWGAPDLLAGWRYRGRVLTASAGIILSVFSVCTWQQIGHWKNSVELFTHATNNSTNNFIAHYNLAVALNETGRTDEAISHINAALNIIPTDADSYYNLGYALREKGMIAEAISAYSKAVLLRPGFTEAHFNLGILLFQQTRLTEAIREFSETLRYRPDYHDARIRLEIARAELEKQRRH